MAEDARGEKKDAYAAAPASKLPAKQRGGFRSMPFILGEYRIHSVLLLSVLHMLDLFCLDSCWNCLDILSCPLCIQPPTLHFTSRIL
jgi:hypothetical protein